MRSRRFSIAPGALDLLRDMAREFPLFIDLLRNVEMALGKVDLATARLYSSLVEDAALRERIYDLFEAEFHRTVRAVLAVTDQAELLEDNPVLARSIKLRNPYVDPMHLIQVDMLRRKRAGEDTPKSTAPSPPPSAASPPGSETRVERPGPCLSSNLARLALVRTHPVGLGYLYASMSLTPLW